MPRFSIREMLRVLYFIAFFGWTCLWTPLSAYGLDPNKAITQYNHNIWQDGLPHNSVTSIAQTRDGYLWFGTYEGLVRFNGVEFTVFDKNNTPTFAKNGILALQTTSDGALWIGTNGGGVLRYKDYQFTHFGKADGIANDYILTMFEDSRRTLWIGTDSGGLCAFQNQHFQVYGVAEGLTDTTVRSINEAPNGDVWIGTASAGLFRFRNGTLTPFMLRTGQSNDTILSMGRDASGAIWVGTGSGSIYQINHDTIELVGHAFQDPILALYRTREGGMWIGSAAEGLSRIFNGRLSTYGIREGLSNNVVRAIFEDREGSLWVGTDGGINRFKEGKFLNFTIQEGLAGNDARPIFQDRSGAIWIGTIGGGLSCYQDGKFTTYTTKDGLSRNIVRALCQDAAGALWIGTDGGGLCRFQDGKFTTYSTQDGLPHHTIRAVTPSQDGGLWVGTYGHGLCYFKDGKFTTYTTKDGLARNVIFGLFEDRRGTLWVSTFGGGVTWYKDGTWSVLSTKQGMANDQVWAFYEDQAEDAMWMGTNGGLALYRNGRVTSFTGKQGLVDEGIFQVLEDGKGFLWCSTGKGIFRVNKKVLLDIANHVTEKPAVMVQYNKADGLSGNQCSGACFPAGWKAADGRLWIPTNAGVTVIDPNNIQVNLQPPPVKIERVTVDGEPVVLTGPIEIPPGRDKIEFFFAGLTFLAPEKVRFRYKLEGYDRDWLDAGTSRSVRYTNLPPHSYRFRVIACNNDGIWNEQGDQIQFSLRPYLYQTNLAILFYLATFGALVFGGVRYRTATLRHRNEALEAKVRSRTAELAKTVEQLRFSETELQEKATELAGLVEQLQSSEKRAQEANHAKSVFLANMSHELRTPLNAVLGFAQLMERERNRTAEDRKRLGIIMRSGEHLLGLINDVLSISKIEAGKLTLIEQTFELTRLLQTLEEMFQLRAQSKALKLKFEIAPDLPQFIVGDEGKLRQILINLIGNGLKFTKIGYVAVRVQYREGACRFEVEDTGMGIGQNELANLFEAFVQTESGRKIQEGTGLGLTISQNFVRLMGGEIEVVSQEGKGSTFSFEIPVKVAAKTDRRQKRRRALRLVPGQPRFRILIVDDADDSRKLMNLLLSSLGFDVREAINGRHAIEVWSEWYPHLIWMDMSMPVMSGYEATREIRHRFESLRHNGKHSERKDVEPAENGQRKKRNTGSIQIPLPNPSIRDLLNPEPTLLGPKIIALSASVLEQERLRILEAGCDDFVAKPYREAIIIDKMAEHLGVKFLFEGDPQPVVAASPPDELPHPDRLRHQCAGLPQPLVARLKKELEAGDVDGALVVAGQIQEHNAELAQEMREFIRTYRFDELLGLFEN
ncbi:MAG: response regulator [Blastocatellia bacterium]|nr:response regulator [Blastocatellia bacterium]